MAESGATLLARLAAVVGPGHVLTASADIEPSLILKSKDEKGDRRRRDDDSMDGGIDAVDAA